MIANNLQEILQEIPAQVQLVAVSKFHPASLIEEAYQAGQRIFGESRVQELTAKYELLPKDIEWHFIGHLQTNKIKYIVPFVSLIHAIDSFNLLKEIDKQAQKVDRKIPCLLQIHIATEESKFGFSYDECRQMLNEGMWQQLHHIEIAGLMGMATNTDNVTLINKEFEGLKLFFDELKSTTFANSSQFKHLSMGMSQDYPEAIKAGSNMIRVGSKIFGQRVY